jgi:hypothetical protein
MLQRRAVQQIAHAHADRVVIALATAAIGGAIGTSPTL